MRVLWGVGSEKRHFVSGSEVTPAGPTAGMTSKSHRPGETGPNKEVSLKTTSLLFFFKMRPF